MRDTDFLILLARGTKQGFWSATITLTWQDEPLSTGVSAGSYKVISRSTVPTALLRGKRQYPLLRLIPRLVIIGDGGRIPQAAELALALPLFLLTVVESFVMVGHRPSPASLYGVNILETKMAVPRQSLLAENPACCDIVHSPDKRHSCMQDTHSSCFVQSY